MPASESRLGAVLDHARKATSAEATPYGVMSATVNDKML